MTEHTRDSIVEAAKQAAARAARPISRADFTRLTGIGQHHIYRLFPEGGWSELKGLAGLERHPKDNQVLSENELLAEFHRIASDLGDIPTWAVFEHRADISADTIRRRLGGLQGTLRKYSDWLKENDPESPLVEKLNLRSRHEMPHPPTPVSTRGPEAAEHALDAWPKSSGPEFGPPLNFRGLRHAPINEQGVVFLFGMVAYELGFIVEAVHASYPDCEAKRRTDARGDRWQRVRIEFEFRSRTFMAHGHDASQCDLIVCWEHDWPDCPLEVVELRKVLDELEG
jgi:hypothetical protein